MMRHDKQVTRVSRRSLEPAPTMAPARDYVCSDDVVATRGLASDSLPRCRVHSGTGHRVGLSSTHRQHESDDEDDHSCAHKDVADEIEIDPWHVHLDGERKDSADDE